ncbi:hypothetical protein V8F20_011117 [Naviculisporaceae sp. PSN 640]
MVVPLLLLYIFLWQTHSARSSRCDDKTNRLRLQLESQTEISNTYWPSGTDLEFDLNFVIAAVVNSTLSPN